jgi:hypothetical protein
VKVIVAACLKILFMAFTLRDDEKFKPLQPLTKLNFKLSNSLT